MWGCLAKILIPQSKKRKLGLNTFNATFIAYTILVKVNSIVESENVDFFESIFIRKLVEQTL